jgi:anti-sigma factor RsiW
LIAFLDDYIAGSLQHEQRETFDRHLAACPSCRAYLHGYRETIRLAKANSTEIEDVPPEVLTAILATLK